MNNKGEIGEFDLIARIFVPLAANQPFSLGLTDDAAVIRPEAGHDIVVTTDSLSAGVHFRDADPPEAVASRALGANVSDLTAMGATPVGYTLAIAAPSQTPLEWYEAFARRLSDDQSRYGIGLVGGDTTASHGGLCLTITAIGQVPEGCAVLRSTAAQGDDIWVTGFIGDAALGLDVLEGRIKPASPADHSALTTRFLYPDARVGAVGILQRVASSAIDVSDGLIADLGHLAKASGLGAVIEHDDVPVSPASQRLLNQPGTGGQALWRRLVTGGDDYEVVFTAPPMHRSEIETAAATLDFGCTRIGRMNADNAPTVTVVDPSGEEITIEGPGGYRHFSA